ncbi:enoyl-CoA hydratase/isomerase family protein [Amycolatopsis sp. CB00013]|uniref:enoyl-CoA hydratase/isomerase family protein n=1 Tax=Amycolatopsis sp. CB00013 TaxID=1703945 RepID=UPI00093BEA92|nr:enoyl-CoA hydratase/isomerase family protein [Amycolatopsis sp. CB00013]OKJ95575.1 enoyl-CoA hydratase [Amycolatopsis sp. CB00013]
MSREPVRLDCGDGVARIGLAVPERKNAIDLELATALAEAVSTVAAMPDLGATVLYAEGDSFCVGGDLRTFADTTTPGALVGKVAHAAHAAIRGLRALKMPVISAVQGACAGGGLGIALAADIVIAGSDARFRTAYTAAGLSPDGGVSWILTRTLGPARAADLILTNRQLDAGTAERYGLVSRVTDNPLDDACKLAHSLARGPRQALAASARLVREAPTTTLEPYLDNEARQIAALADTAEGSEGITAFLEHRPADFGKARTRTQAGHRMSEVPGKLRKSWDLVE